MGGTMHDVEALAALVRPHLSGPVTIASLSSAVARAQAEDEDEWYRRVGQVHIFTEALSGTYDEFRAGVSS